MYVASIKYGYYPFIGDTTSQSILYRCLVKCEIFALSGEEFKCAIGNLLQLLDQRVESKSNTLIR